MDLQVKVKKVSIIISVYNDRNGIAINIDNIRELSGFNVQWVVVDGGSTDGTFELLSENSSIIDILISESDEGIYDAWNKGLECVDGDWILFLGAGDKIFPDWIKKLQCERNDVGFIYGDMIIRMQKEPKEVFVNKIADDWAVAKNKIKYGLSIPLIGTGHSYELFEKQRYDKEFKIVGDWEFVLRNINAGGRYCNGVHQAEMVMGGVSNAPARLAAKFIERKKVKQMYDLGWSMMDLKYYVIKSIAGFPNIYKDIQCLWHLLKGLKI